MAGIGRQDVEFWEYLGKFDFISLNETWVEEEGWNRIKGNLPKTHVWECCFAKREKRKGRARGGFIIIIGLRKGWGGNNCDLIRNEVEGIIESRTGNVRGKDLTIGI